MANRKSQIRGRRSPSFAVCCLLFGSLLLAVSCEERIIYDRPMLAGLPGAQTNREVTGPRVEGAIPADVLNETDLVVKNPDGTKTLIARTGRHLMVHIYNTLREDEPDLFVDQVLSERTRAEYYQRGLQPVEAYKTLKKRLPDIKKLFDQMPMGEYTPGLYVRNLADDVTRLEANGSGIRGLTWVAMDMVFEEGNWRLVWFAGPGQ